MGKMANIVASPSIQATATPEAAPSMDRAAPLIQDNGPILGVPSTQDQGKIVAAAPEIPTAETLPGQPEPPFSWWAVIGGLAALALASGGTAVWLRRRAGA
jgi:hypothetical protein